MIIESNIHIQETDKSRLESVDMNNIPFGRIFGDHMLVAEYKDGKWNDPVIKPYGPLGLEPSMSALNYGQSIFEGMKAFRGPLGEGLLFRPRENYKRMNRSAHRMCMPEIAEAIFMDGLLELIRLDKGWIPPSDLGALYIRPLYFATDTFIGVRDSDNYTFVIFTSPVGPYYTEPVNLLVNRDYVRAAIGGTGAAKTAGNYAAAMLPDKLAKAEGYHNVLWLDARELTYIEECGTMNIFFVIDGKVITPALSGTILPGITRHSAIQLLRSEGYEVEERKISIHELDEAYEAGTFDEAFGAGTAATFSPIAKIRWNGRDMVLPPVADRKIGPWLNETLGDIKCGLRADTFGWNLKV